MGTLRAFCIFVVVFSMIEVTLLLIVGVSFFPPRGDKECNYAAATEIPNLANARKGRFTCVNLVDIANLLRRTFIPFKRPTDNFLWQLSFHCVTVLIITIILFLMTKCEKGYTKPAKRHIRRVIARYDQKKGALIGKRPKLIRQKTSYPEIC